jgi:hypothetical protein
MRFPQDRFNNSRHVWPAIPTFTVTAIEPRLQFITLS